MEQAASFGLLDAVTQPVFVLSEEAVCYVNPVAASFGIRVGQKLYDFLFAQSYPLPSKAGVLFDCELRGASFRALCTARGKYAIYSLTPAKAEPEHSFPGRTLAHTSASIRRILHEMQTAFSALYEPLTREENESTLRCAASTLRGIYRLERVAENLDSLQTLLSEDFTPFFEPLDLTQLLTEQLSKAEELLRYAEITLEADVPAGLGGCTDRRLLSLLLWNLLSNAAADCEGGKISCSVRKNDETLELCVENRSFSPLLAQDSLHERYTVRMEDSLTQHGVGVGMSVIRAAAGRLGGRALYGQTQDRTVSALVSIDVSQRSGASLRSDVLIAERSIDEGLVGLSDVLPYLAFDIRDLL